MLRKVAFAGCVLAGASCLYADDPVQSEKMPLGGVMTAGAINITPVRDRIFRKNIGTLELLFDNGPVSYEGVLIDDDLITPAVLLYDNGDDNYSNGNEMCLWMEANDFVLKGQSNVEHIDFSVLNTQSGNNNANFDGNVAWSIFADAGGSPGSLIASGVGNNVVADFDRFSTWDFWDFSFDLDSAQCLDAGTYWLGLVLNTGCDSRDELYWGTTNGGNGTAHAEGLNCSALGVSVLEHSFSVSGTDGCGGGGEVCVDFEDNGPCIFNSTNPLRGLYAGDGINFDGPTRLDGGGILNECGNFGVGARSGTDFLAFNRAHNGGVMFLNGGFPEDPETVRFDSDASAVSVWVSGGVNVARWKMDAFDGNGNLVTSSSTSSNSGAYAELAVSGSGIRSVVVTETSGISFFVWDDLCVTLGGSGDCLDMTVSTLRSGQTATWDVSGVTPNTEVAIVWGTGPGNTSINGFAGYCADFGIKGVNANRVVCRSVSNGAGNVSCQKRLPGGIVGMRVLTQAAERNTCPDVCMSGVDDQIVQ